MVAFADNCGSNSLPTADFKVHVMLLKVELGGEAQNWLLGSGGSWSQCSSQSLQLIDRNAVAEEHGDGVTLLMVDT
jgi:hypothetical protein